MTPTPTPPVTAPRSRFAWWSRRPAWARWTIVLAGIPLALVVLGWAWQQIRLARIPDVGDPFDVAAFKQAFPNDMPDDVNAFSYYQRAMNSLPSRSRTFADMTVVDDWTFASPELKARAEEAREARDLWRQGAEQDDGVYHRLEEMSVSTLLQVTQELRGTFSTLALLEGSRLEAEGDMAGAWGWYRALLRCSRHSGRNGFLIERMVGVAIHEKAAARIQRWAADERVDGDLLRQAQADVQAAEAMTVADDAVEKLEYLIESQACRDPKQFAELIMNSQPQSGPAPSSALAQQIQAWHPKRLLQQARIASGFEQERSRRIVQLVWANRLPQLARPPSQRAAIAVPDPVVFAADPTAPPSANALPPEDLAREMRSSPLGEIVLDWFGKWLERLDKERSERARLILEIALQRYRRDHDGARPPNWDALVPDYLDQLPEAIADPTP